MVRREGGKASLGVVIVTRPPIHLGDERLTDPGGSND